MGVGDISHLASEQIYDLCRKYSRGKAKSNMDSREYISKVTKSTTGSVTRAKLGKLFDNFKIDLLSTLSSHIDTLKTRKMKEE